MSAPAFPAFRFDGRHAEARPVQLVLDARCVVVATAEGTELERERLDRLAVSEPFDHAPRLISLPNGVTLEVFDEDRGFTRALRYAGLDVPLTVRLQRWWPGVIAAVVVLVGLLIAGYVRGLPAAARSVAFALPPHLERRMGQQFLTVLDKHHFKPSRLDPARRERISGRFADAAARMASSVSYRLEFRAAGEDEINAVALPGGTIILLDGLVKFAGDDEAVLGVLAHELGHVAHKHSAQQILLSVGVGAVAGLLWGDFSGVAASVPVALGVLRYSREFEREADDFALVFLRAPGLSVQPLYQFFTQLRALESRRGIAEIPAFMSTHPSSEERLERLRWEIK